VLGSVGPDVLLFHGLHYMTLLTVVVAVVVVAVEVNSTGSGTRSSSSRLSVHVCVSLC